MTNIVLLYTKLTNIVVDYKLPIQLNGHKSHFIKINFCFHDEGIYLLPLLFIAKTEDKQTKIQRTLKEIRIKVRMPPTYFNNIDVQNNNRGVLSYRKKPQLLFELDHLEIIEGVKPPNQYVVYKLREYI